MMFFSPKTTFLLVPQLSTLNQQPFCVCASRDASLSSGITRTNFGDEPQKVDPGIPNPFFNPQQSTPLPRGGSAALRGLPRGEALRGFLFA
jgi:hypothetical protein